MPLGGGQGIAQVLVGCRGARARPDGRVLKYLRAELGKRLWYLAWFAGLFPRERRKGGTLQLRFSAARLPYHCRMVTPTARRNQRAGVWNQLRGARERWRARDACERESCVKPCIPQIPTASLVPAR